MDARTRAFQVLKPSCVALSQAALALSSSQTQKDTQLVVVGLEDLKARLSTIISHPHALDEKLAEYIFFPLSQLLKASRNCSIRCLELVFECLALIIQHGWKSKVQPELAAQLVILCTLMADKNPKGVIPAETTSELQVAAFACLYRLFAVLSPASASSDLLTKEANIPQLGQTISVILDGIQLGSSRDIQTTAARALDALVSNVASSTIKTAFLPGIASRLTIVLTPSSDQRRDPQCLIILIGILKVLIGDLLCDEPPANTTAAKTLTDSGSSSAKNPLTPSEPDWKKKASQQLGPAIVKIMRLRSHSRSDVREALGRLCLSILEKCRIVLVESCPVALECIIAMSTESLDNAVLIGLEMLVLREPACLVLLQNATYNWIQHLPILYQSADEQAKASKMREIGIAYGLLARSEMDLSWLDKTLTDALRDCVVMTLHPGSTKHVEPLLESQIHSLSITDGSEGSKTMQYNSPLIKYAAQRPLLESIYNVARTVSPSMLKSGLATSLVRSLPMSRGDTQIAVFWLAITTIEAALDKDREASELMLYIDSRPPAALRSLEEMYSFSLGVLTDDIEEAFDPRMHSLALRTLGMQATQIADEFRHELIDALYPVLHAMATPDEQVQHASLVTLNLFTSACKYGSVKDLIVQNVDYLTNAVALKLNAFDVSPQAPQVLLMMIKLAGPSLLPYLEDTIESIFAALHDYHGYPLLVELLFKVLSAMAEEGAKTPLLAIEAGTVFGRDEIGTKESRLIGITDVVESIRTRHELQKNKSEGVKEAHPKKPWASAKASSEDNADSDEDNEEQKEANDSDDNQEVQADEADAPPPAPRTYKLLLKIADLTQHFLPSASPSLRTSLLGLIKTAIPAIARHENSFLPLINTLWPEIVSRLDDPEAHVVAATLDTIVLLCTHAGDFMRTRIIRLWPGLVDIHTRTAKSILQNTRIKAPAMGSRQESQRPAPSTSLILRSESLALAIRRMRDARADYVDGSARAVWEALVRALTAMVEFTALSPEMFDEALAMLEPVIDEDPDVRKALERQNADAVWLARVRMGSEIPKRTGLASGGHRRKFPSIVLGMHGVRT
jgi:hypothetical protein